MSLTSRRIASETDFRTSYIHRPAPIEVRSSTYSTSKPTYITSAYLPSYQAYSSTYIPKYVPSTYRPTYSTRYPSTYHSHGLYSSSAYLPSYTSTSRYYGGYSYSRPNYYSTAYESYSPSRISSSRLTRSAVIERPVISRSYESYSPSRLTRSYVDRPVVSSTYKTFSPLTHSYLYSHPTYYSSNYYGRPWTYSAYADPYVNVEDPFVSGYIEKLKNYQVKTVANTYAYENPYTVERVVEI